MLAQGPAAVLEDLIARARADREWFGVYLEAIRVIRRDPELWRRWEQRTLEAGERVSEAVEEWQARGLVRRDLTVENVLVLIFTLLDGIVLQTATSPVPTYEEYAVLPGLVAHALAPTGVDRSP